MENHKTDRNRATRMRIGDTIIQLMDKHDLSDITISKITQTANISRMTFYHYYDTKEAALIDYLAEIILMYLKEVQVNHMEGKLHTLEDLTFALEFFSQYDRFMLQMDKNGCYHILIQGVNQFLATYFKDYFAGAPYHLYYYAGALLNVFLEWLKNGQKESPSEIARLILSY